MENTKYDVIVLDIRMPGLEGIETLSKIYAIDKKVSVIIYTAYSNYNSNYMTWTADAYVIKSADLRELKVKYRNSFQQRKETEA